MGKPMALNLLAAGYQLTVFARNPASRRPLVEAGAEEAPSCAALAAECEIIFIMVSDTPDVTEVISGEQGILTALKPGSIVVDMSTISPQTTRQLAEQIRETGGEMLDAPVSGGETGAIEGNLSIMVGGKDTAYAKVLPLFQKLGKNIVHVGDHGAGQTAKACNQLLVAQTISAVAEAIEFAKASGVDPQRVRDALMGGFANSKILEVHGTRMLNEDYQPGFKARLHQKDLRIVMEAARDMGLFLPGAAQAAQYLNRLVGSGEGELDSAAIAKVIQRLNRT